MNDIKDLVSRDLRSKTTKEEHDYLRSPENVDLWIDTLKSLKNEIESQLSSKEAKWPAARLSIMDQAKTAPDNIIYHREICESYNPRSNSRKCNCLPYQGTAEHVWLQFKNEQVNWRSRALKVLASVEQGLLEAKQLRRSTEEPKVSVIKAINAIRNHKKTLEANDMQATDEDKVLWSILETNES